MLEEANMFVAESEAKLRHIERSEHGFHYISTRDLGSVFDGVRFCSVNGPYRCCRYNAGSCCLQEEFSASSHKSLSKGWR